MKKWFYKVPALILAVTMLFAMTACGAAKEEQTQQGTQEVANDYYIDLTDLGMKLTIYLRLDAEGNFLFSNTLAFEVNKSAGTFQKSGDEYIMVYESVNGEAKTMSDGLTSSFVVTEDGSLDFSGCEKIYYGSASVDRNSAENPDTKIIAHIVTEDFAAPETKSDFSTGTYVAETVEKDGVSYHHIISFYEDKTYLHILRYEQDGKMVIASEHGTYGISTTQLALGDHGGERAEGEVLSSSAMKLSLFAVPDDAERTMLEFTKTDAAAELAVLTGTGTVTGSEETFAVTLKVYEDGSYVTEAGGFTENGVLVIDTAEGTFKQYPNHPDTGVRGLLQVETVPSGMVVYKENGNLTFTDLRVRNSEDLARYKANVE